MALSASTMKRPSRAPSPTPTTFSAISTYRNDSYRARPKDVPALPIDYRAVSRIHFQELNRYLADYLAKASPNSRTTARQKLTRLTIQQFHELSTDVFDELVRRSQGDEVPFLPVKEEFHPKRNQARQKLATLPISRFEDLSSDVYFELTRRYPEFKEDPSGGRVSTSSNYDDYPAPGFPTTSASSSRSQPNSRASGRVSSDRERGGPSDSGYGGSRRPSEDRRRPSEDYPMPRRSEESYRRPDDSFATRKSEDGFGGSSRRKPSHEVNNLRRSEDRDRSEYGRRPSGTTSTSGTSDSTTTGIPTAQSATAISGMIIPQKSTIEEEDIKIPYGQDKRESGSTTMDERSGENMNYRDTRGGGYNTDGEPDSASDYPSPMSPRNPPAGLGGLAARLRNVGEDDDDEGNASGHGTRSGGEEYYAIGSDRGGSGLGLRMRGSVSEEQEKMRRDYEYKIATMQSQIGNLTRELEASGDAERRRKEEEARLQAKVEELESIRWQLDEQANIMGPLQKELNELKEARQRDKDRESRRVQDDLDELQILRQRVEELERDKEDLQMQTDQQLIEQLRGDVEGLVTELNDLSRRNDELMTAKENDLHVIRDLDSQLKEYKRKYEQAKTELRNVKATSQLFSQGIKVDRVEDQLPAAPDGGILDIHITAFVSAIDSLLVAGRNNAPTRVLSPMKNVVNAVTNILDDTRTFERRPARERADVDIEALRALRDRADATLSNLVAASKTHATSSGMSPVSLLDAAASHVSVCVSEIGRTVLIRKATKAEMDQFPYTNAPVGSSLGNSPSPSSGFIPMRTIEELRTFGGGGGGGHNRKGSSVSNSSRGFGRFTDSPTAVPSAGNTNSGGKGLRRPMSDQSSSEQTNSPPPIFDRQNGTQEGTSDDSGIGEGSEDAWSELRPYLDAQTESIVYAIQSVLSGVRNPTPSTSVLHENITQIITIVSSIVAVCKDNIPAASVQQGQELLGELSEHANRLSEVQELTELTKESRQTMAKSSFAIANAMKGLMKL